MMVQHNVIIIFFCRLNPKQKAAVKQQSQKLGFNSRAQTQSCQTQYNYSHLRTHGFEEMIAQKENRGSERLGCVCLCIKREERLGGKRKKNLPLLLHLCTSLKKKLYFATQWLTCCNNNLLTTASIKSIYTFTQILNNMQSSKRVKIQLHIYLASLTTGRWADKHETAMKHSSTSH